MRIVFVGAGKVTVETAKALIAKDHEVIIIDVDKAKIEELSEEMECSFLHGDGSSPKILKEVDPKKADFLFCMTGSDKDNVIASLVGRSLGFKRVVTSIGDPEFETICYELGLEDTIIRSRPISRYMQDMVNGNDNVDTSTVFKDEARLFTLVVKEDDAVMAKDLKLPTDAKAICYYRDGAFSHADEKTRFRVGDEVLILTHARNMSALHDRWKIRENNSGGKEKAQSPE